MSAVPLPPGARRIERLQECIADLDAASAKLRGAMAQVNDPELRSRLSAFVRANDEVLAATGTEPGPDVADRLNDLLTGLRRLDISVRDPDFGLRPALEPVEAAAGVVALRLIAALDAAAALGWHPRAPELPEPLGANVRREETGGLLERIARRLDMVAESLDRLAAAGESAGNASQKRLIGFYAGAVRIELDLAKMQLTVGETTVDLAALWRSAEAIAELTGDFVATLSAWARAVSQPVREAGEIVRHRVRMMVQGVARVARVVARRRRQAEQDAPPASAEGVSSPPAPEMVALPAGEFLMGSPEDEDERSPYEGPQHRVRIARPYAIGRYPVTFAEYDRFCRATGRREADDQNWGRGRRPVIDVSRDDAQAYLAWLSQNTGRQYRLPSEAEWEFACRAGTTTRYSFGDRITAKDANWLEAEIGHTTEVGTYPPNPWGLCDMHGNVWEWVEDDWHDNYHGAPPDGSAWRDTGTGRNRSLCVLRGGS